MIAVVNRFRNSIHTQSMLTSSNDLEDYNICKRFELWNIGDCVHSLVKIFQNKLFFKNITLTWKEFLCAAERIYKFRTVSEILDSYSELTILNEILKFERVGNKVFKKKTTKC